MMKPLACQTALSGIVAVLLIGWGTPSRADFRIRDICRVKGQEQNTLHGFGLVVGLSGTGDGDVPATRALAQTMKFMGNAIPSDKSGKAELKELEKAKNVALVFVTATVPAEGARQGGELDCTVSAISAKSLKGGYLLLTPLLGPRPGSDQVYAYASGPITLEDSSLETSGKIQFGCRLEEDFLNIYSRDDHITLVLKPNHASFETAQEVEYAINGDQEFSSFASTSDGIAKAIDPKNVVVGIPEVYQEKPVEFVSAILNVSFIRPPRASRVVINERSKVIVIGSDVEILPVAISHKNLTIEAGGDRTANEFVPFSPAEVSSEPTAKLKSLVDALNALKIETKDIIDIIKAIHREGALYGDLVIQ